MLRTGDDWSGQHFTFRADGASPATGKTGVTIGHGPQGPTATIPDAHLLFNAEFTRAGSDLILRGDGKTAVVHDYFASDKHPTLLSPNGAALAPGVVDALAGSQAPGQYAQAGTPQGAAQPVGHVAVVHGDAVIVRNGVAMTLQAGAAVLKGDVLQTNSGTLGVTFNDGSTINLTANSRVVVNEFIYDSHGANNSEILNLVQGSLSFISGEVAHSGGNMKIGTPVATMGIRGTVGGVTESTDGTVQFYVVQSDHGAVIEDANGNVIAQVVQDGPLIEVRPVGPLQVVAEEISKSPAELAAELAALQEIISTQQIGQQINQQFFQNNPNPQSTEHHTQIEIDIPLNTITAIVNNTSTDDHTTTVLVTTTDKTPTGDTTTTTTQYTPLLTTNLPPVNFAPPQASVIEDQKLTFSGNNTITVSDPDTNILTVTLTATYGVLRLNAPLTITAGAQDSTTMTFSGTQANINNALNSLTFTPNYNYVGTDATLQIQTSDGQSTTTDTIAINITPYQSIYWTGADDRVSWDNIGNWDPDQIPTAGDDVFIGTDRDGGVVAPAMANRESTPISVHSLSLTNGADLVTPGVTTSGDLTIDNATLESSGNLNIADSGDSLSVSAVSSNHGSSNIAEISADHHLKIGDIAGNFIVEASAGSCSSAHAEISAASHDLTIGIVGGDFTVSAIGSGGAANAISKISADYFLKIGDIGDDFLLSAKNNDGYDAAAEIVSTNGSLKIGNIAHDFTVETAAAGSYSSADAEISAASHDLTIGSIGGDFTVSAAGSGYQANATSKINAGHWLKIGDIAGNFLLSATSTYLDNYLGNATAEIMSDGGLTIGNITGDFTVVGGGGCSPAHSEISAASHDLTIGNIGGSFHNEGLIDADCGTLTIGSVTGTFVNTSTGTLQAGAIDISACADPSYATTFENQGLVESFGKGAGTIGIDVHNTGTVEVDGQGHDVRGLGIDIDGKVTNSGNMLALGGGYLGLWGGLTNESSGIIEATGSATAGYCGPVVPSEIDISGRVTNRGTIEAGNVCTSGGLVVIQNATVDNRWGLIAAKNGGEVELENTAIKGGTLWIDACWTCSLIAVICDVTFDGTAHALTIDGHGAVEVFDGAKLTLRGNIHIDGSVTLSGHGIVQLDGWDTHIAGSGYGGTLVNVSDTITGTGKIGDGSCDLTLVNQGEIKAAHHDHIVIDTGHNAVDNDDGTILATRGGTIDICSDVTNHHNGLIEAQDGGQIDFDGSVDNSHSSLIEAKYGGEIDFNGGVHNDGTIEAQSGGTIDFNHWVGGSGTLAIDGGTIELGSGTCNTVDFSGSCGGSLVLDNVDAFHGQITGFGPGDAIDLASLSDVSILSYTANACGTGGVLDLQSSSLGNFDLSLTADGSHNYTTDNFVLSDLSGGTLITEAPAISVAGIQVDGGNGDILGVSTTVTDIAILDPFAGNDVLTFTAHAGYGTLAFADADGNPISNTDDGGQMLTATGTLAEIDNELSQGVIYTNPTVDPLPLTDKIELNVNDGHGGQEALNFIFSVADASDVTLTGTAGNDVIFSSEHNDTMTGNGGNDTFVFGQNNNDNNNLIFNDHITDFSTAHDVIQFDSSVFQTVSDVLAAAHADGSDTVITTAQGTITLNGVSITDFDTNPSNHIVIDTHTVTV